LHLRTSRYERICKSIGPPDLSDLIGEPHHRLSEEYSVHRISDYVGDFVLLHNGIPVGCYWGEVLAVAEEHMGKKLSVPLVLAAVSERPLPKQRKLSPGGKKALEYAWMVARNKVENPWP